MYMDNWVCVCLHVNVCVCGHVYLIKTYKVVAYSETHVNTLNVNIHPLHNYTYYTYVHKYYIHIFKRKMIQINVKYAKLFTNTTQKKNKEEEKQYRKSMC